jgi:protein-tyrosine phosphatase
MTKILMVCLGNICRSPVAEGVMRDVLKKKRLDCVVDSAGTAAYHVGEAPDRRSQKNALKHNIDISNLKARQFTVKDFDDFDRIYVMDESNYQNVLKLSRSQKDIDKVKFLSDELYPQQHIPVPDPYYDAEDGFENVFQLIHKSCVAIADKL